MFQKNFDVSKVTVKLGAFVDDFELAGDRKGADAAWMELRQLFVLGETGTCRKFAVINKMSTKVRPRLRTRR